MATLNMQINKNFLVFSLAISLLKLFSVWYKLTNVSRFYCFQLFKLWSRLKGCHSTQKPFAVSFLLFFSPSCPILFPLFFTSSFFYSFLQLFLTIYRLSLHRPSFFLFWSVSILNTALDSSRRHIRAFMYYHLPVTWPDSKDFSEFFILSI
jgi:hypothetical protein